MKMFENDSDILYYIVEIDSKTYSLFNRNTDTLILSDVSFDEIKKFLLKNNPIHPALGSNRTRTKVPGSSPVIIPTKTSSLNKENLCAIGPSSIRDKIFYKKEYNKISKKITPRPSPSLSIVDGDDSNKDK